MCERSRKVIQLGQILLLIFTFTPSPNSLALGPSEISHKGQCFKSSPTKWDTPLTTCYIICSLRWFYVSRCVFVTVVISLAFAIGILFHMPRYGVGKRHYNMQKCGRVMHKTGINVSSTLAKQPDVYQDIGIQLASGFYEEKGPNPLA